MALTPLRWTAALIAGCLLAVAYFYAPSDRIRRPNDRRETLAERERRLGSVTTRGADRLRATIVIDSVRRGLPRAPAGDTLRVFIGNGIPAVAHPEFANAARLSAATLGTPRLHADIAFVLDTTENVRGVARGAGRVTAAEYVLPIAAGERCLTVIRLRQTTKPDEANVHFLAIAHRLTEQRLLGPCAFVGAFGRPGPHVARWLDRGAWGYALIAGWTQRSPKWQPPAWYGQRDHSDGWPLRYYVSIDGYRCATGDERACDAAITDPAPSSRTSALPQTWGNRIISTAPDGNEWWYRLNLGPRQGIFLSDVAQAVGPEKFRLFWTSTEPVAAAFQSATGRSFASATRDWMRVQYEGYVGRGAAVPRLTAGLAFLFIAGGTAAAMAAARRRRVL